MTNQSESESPSPSSSPRVIQLRSTSIRTLRPRHYFVRCLLSLTIISPLASISTSRVDCLHPYLSHVTMTSRAGLRFAQFTRAARASFRQPIGRRFQTTDAAAAPEQTTFQRLWNSPIGIKTVHFWYAQPCQLREHATNAGIGLLS